MGLSCQPLLIPRPLADLLSAGTLGRRHPLKDSNGALSRKVIFNSTDPESDGYFLPVSSIMRKAYSQIHALMSRARPQQTHDVDESPRWGIC